MQLVLLCVDRDCLTVLLDDKFADYSFRWIHHGCEKELVKRLIFVCCPRTPEVVGTPSTMVSRSVLKNCISLLTETMHTLYAAGFALAPGVDLTSFP